MHIMVSLACHADSSIMLGWISGWRRDQFPYIKMYFFFQSPKAIREIIQKWWGKVLGRCRSSGKQWSSVYFKRGWGEKGIEKSADSLHGQ